MNHENEDHVLIDRIYISHKQSGVYADKNGELHDNWIGEERILPWRSDGGDLFQVMKKGKIHYADRNGEVVSK